MYRWATCAMNHDHTYLVTPGGDLIVSRCTRNETEATVEGEDTPVQQSGIITNEDEVEYNGSIRVKYSNGSTHRLLGGKSENPVPSSTSSVVDGQDESTKSHNDVDNNVRESLTSGIDNRYNSFTQEYSYKIHDDLSNGQIMLINQNTAESIPSFDYSHGCHVHDNIETHALKKDLNHQKKSTEIYLPLCENVADLYGIPAFFGGLCQIKVTKLSAHPLGTHCLFISSEGLLFSFGSKNDHGQIGNGTRKSCSKPTILTPILENGGKAIDCAAGSAHSLVVVKTDGKRVKKYLAKKKKAMSVFSRVTDDKFGDKSTVINTSLFSGANNFDEPPVCLHQVYGFGSNAHMKLGLVDSRVSESKSVLLPRRVALHCQVSQHPGAKEGVKYGIFNIAASVNHSAALVRRSNGGTELYTWGYARDDALGMDVPNTKVVVTPTLVRNFPSYLNCQSSRKYASDEAAISTLLSSALSKSLSFSEKSNTSSTVQRKEVLDELVLGDRQTFVRTSGGRVLVFGSSNLGLLGIGAGSMRINTPTEICFSDLSQSQNNSVKARITKVSVGLHHAIAIDKDGSLWRWGSTEFGKLGSHIEGTCDNKGIIWCPSKFKISEAYQAKTVALACCGLDATVIVMSCGAVMSCGKQTGRLGQGKCSVKNMFENNDYIYDPFPMFGGVRLWYNPEV